MILSPARTAKRSCTATNSDRPRKTWPRAPNSIRAQTPLPVRYPQSQAYEDVLRIVEALNAG